ncbi:MAG: TolC family protein [Gemmatimonadetes bacterium]|nr:TolC family protein [Gemmatimonadota bacterium]
MRPTSSLLLLLAVAPLAAAQNPAPSRPAAAAPAGPSLSLDDALALARRNNPLYLQSLTGRDRAGAAVRTAYGAFIPTFNTNLSSGYREGLPQFFGGVSFGAVSSTLNTNLSFDASVDLSPGTWMNPGQQKAGLGAAEADAENAGMILRQGVVSQYILALQQSALARLQDTLLANTQVQLDFARARLAAGASTDLDVRRAEVQVGQQRVASLQAHNQAEVEKLRLFQQLGVNQPGDVRLTTELPVQAPALSLEQLLDEARRSNPAYRAVKLREDAAGIGVRRAKATYLPTFGLQASISGYTQKYVEGSYISTLPAASQTAARAADARFPFDFTRNPYTVSMGLSYPIFNGFRREQQVREATATRSDASYNVRALELKLTADVTAAYLTLQTDVQSVNLNGQNAQTAREALNLSEQRYRVGLNTLVDLIQARADYARAENDRIAAIFQFHRDFAALESAIGRPLR